MYLAQSIKAFLALIMRELLLGMFDWSNGSWTAVLDLHWMPGSEAFSMLTCLLCIVYVNLPSFPFRCLPFSVACAFSCCLSPLNCCLQGQRPTLRHFKHTCKPVQYGLRPLSLSSSLRLLSLTWSLSCRSFATSSEMVQPLMPMLPPACIPAVSCTAHILCAQNSCTTT